MSFAVPETGLSASGFPVVTLIDLNNTLAAIQAAISSFVPTIAALRAATTTQITSASCLVGGYATAGDGGEGVFMLAANDVTSTDNGGTIIVDANGRRWYRGAGQIATSVKWFGATGNGSTDDTAAIQACLTASANRMVYFPPGNYHYTALSLPTGCGIRGSGVQATFLTCTATNGTITVLGPCVISDIAFTSPTPRVAGPTVSCQGNDIQFRNIAASNYFLFAQVGALSPSSVEAVGARFTDSDFFSPAIGPGSGAIYLLNYGNAVVERCIITGPSVGQQPDYGIRLDNGDTAIVNNNNISAHGYALIFETAAGENAYATQVSNCVLDSAGAISGGSHASGLGMAQAGNIEDAQFSNCWFGLSSGGCGALLSPSGGTIRGIDFSGCKFVGNAIDGLSLSGSGVISICVSGGDATANANAGIDILNGATDITITGVRAGNTDGRGSQNIGINLTGAAANCLVVGNNCHGNANSGLVNTATGTNNTVANNVTA